MHSDTGDRPNLDAFVLGLGCERGVADNELIALAERALLAAGIHRRALNCIASLDSRAAEPAMIAVANYFCVPFRVFDAATLEAETMRLKTPSDRVFALTGCHGVAEAAALAVAGKGSDLIVPKLKSARATAAVAVCSDDAIQLSDAVFHEVDSAFSDFDSRVGQAPDPGAGIAS